MALERFRSGGARGIARFLSDHQHCDAGFDVRREAGAGTGRLSITCKGCGEGITYKAAEAGELAAGPPLTNGDGVGVGAPAPAPAPRREPKKPRRPAAPELTAPGPRKPVGTRSVALGRGGLPRWVPTLLIGLVIAAGLAMVAIGISRSGEEGGQAAGPAEATAPAETAPPAETTAPAETTPPEATAPEPTATQAAAPPPAEPPDAVTLRRQSFDTFAIGIPAGWRRDKGGEMPSIHAPGRVAEIVVFSEPGEESLGDLADGAASYLADRHDDARIGRPRPAGFGDVGALRVTAAYGGGEERAFVLAAKSSSYLILCRVDRGLSTTVAAQADAAMASFRPR